MIAKNITAQLMKFSDRRRTWIIFSLGSLNVHSNNGTVSKTWFTVLVLTKNTCIFALDPELIFIPVPDSCSRAFFSFKQHAFFSVLFKCYWACKHWQMDVDPSFSDKKPKGAVANLCQARNSRRHSYNLDIWRENE